MKAFWHLNLFIFHSVFQTILRRQLMSLCFECENMESVCLKMSVSILIFLPGGQDDKKAVIMCNNFFLWIPQLDRKFREKANEHIQNMYLKRQSRQRSLVTSGHNKSEGKFNLRFRNIQAYNDILVRLNPPECRLFLQLHSHKLPVYTKLLIKAEEIKASK